MPNDLRFSCEGVRRQPRNLADEHLRGWRRANALVSCKRGLRRPLAVNGHCLGPRQFRMSWHHSASERLKIEASITHRPVGVLARRPSFES